MKQFTREQAINIFEGGEWKDWTDQEIVRFQLYQDCLCVPFDVFHRAIVKVFHRPVFTHEFAFTSLLIDEYEKERPAPTFDEIMELIPKDKQVIFIGDV